MDLHVWAYPRHGYIFQVSLNGCLGAPGGENLAFPITLAIRFYNSTSRDLLVSNRSKLAR